MAEDKLHDEHVCLSCEGKILTTEPEERVPDDEMARINDRRKRVRKQPLGPIRYRHQTMEQCVIAINRETDLNQWHPRYTEHGGKAYEFTEDPWT